MARRCDGVPEVSGSRRFTEPAPIAGTRGSGTARRPRRRAAEVTGSTCGATMSDDSLRLPSSHVRDAHASGPEPTRGPRIGETAGDIFSSRSSSATGTSGAPSEFHRRRSWPGRPIAMFFSAGSPLPTRSPASRGRARANAGLPGSGKKTLASRRKRLTFFKDVFRRKNATSDAYQNTVNNVLEKISRQPAKKGTQLCDIFRFFHTCPICINRRDALSEEIS